MPNKCAVVDCLSGYKPKKREAEENVKQPVFSFPDDSELQNKWVRFVNRKDFIPIRHNGIYIKHFDSTYLVRGDKRTTLNRHLQPVPTTYDGDLLEEFVKKPSLLRKSTASRNPPRKIDTTIPDEINKFNELDNITNLEILKELSAPAGFSFKKFDDYVLFYRIFYEESNATPFIESINVDKDLRVKLH